MSSLISRSSDFIEDFFKDFPGFYVRPMRSESGHGLGQIRVDVKDNDKAYTVQAEVPGVKKEDIQVSIDGNTVTIKAEVKQEQTEKDASWLRCERYYGASARSFSLPTEVDEAQSKAKYDNGVLTLTLPKSNTSAAKRLAIE